MSKPDNSVRGRRARRSAATGDEPPPTDGGEAAPSSGWQKNRTAREGYAALLTKTRYEREIGDSVNVHDVRQGAFATAKKLQGEALAMPEQLSSEGAMRTREELFEILKAWVVKFCQDLQVPVQREP